MTKSNKPSITEHAEKSNSTKQQVLPQTNEGGIDMIISLLGLALVSVVGIFRRKR